MLRLVLALLLLGPAQAASLPEQVVPGTAGQVIIRRTSEGTQALLVVRDGRRRALLADQSLTAVPLAPISGRPAVMIRGWAGGFYCCFGLHILIRTGAGWHLAGTFYGGKGAAVAPVREGGVLWLPDGQLDFWDLNVGMGTDLRVPMAYRLRHGRLEVDAAAMRGTVADALGPACLRRGSEGSTRRGPPSFRSLPEAVARLNAGTWGTDPRSARSWRPEAEYARRALCLFYGGHGEAALDLMRGWPDGGEERALTLRQMRAVLSCGGGRPRWVALHGAAHPWLTLDCATDDAEVLRNWRL